MTAYGNLASSSVRERFVLPAGTVVIPPYGNSLCMVSIHFKTPEEAKDFVEDCKSLQEKS